MCATVPGRFADLNVNKTSRFRDIREVVNVLDSSVMFSTLLVRQLCTWIIQPSAELLFKASAVNVAPKTKVYPLTMASYFEGLGSLIRSTLQAGQAVTCDNRSLLFLYQTWEVKNCRNKQRIEPMSTVEPAGIIFQEPEASQHPPAPSQRQPGEPLSTREDTDPLSENHEADEEQSFVVASSMQPAQMTFKEPGAPEHRPSSMRQPGERLPTQANSEHSNENVEDLKVGYKKPLEGLYQIFLESVRPLVKGSQVVVVPGRIYIVPFRALVDEDGYYAAETLQVRLVPSLTTAKMIADRPNETDESATPLIVGDPILPEFIRGRKVEFTRLRNALIEVERIGKLLDVKPITAQKATKEAVLQRLCGANLTHIAAHGDMKRGEIFLAPDPSIPRDGVKEEDVLLTPSDLELNRIKANLVVLGCCHSGQGEFKAEGGIGIARAFLGAGAHAVLITQWAIDDEATLYFMKEFYKNLVGGETASEALQRIMKTMMKTDGYSHLGTF